MKLRISFIIPLSLVFLSISISFIVYLESNYDASEKIRANGLKSLKLDMSRLQNMLYNLVTEDSIDIESARLNLSVTAMDSKIKVLLLTNENNQIMTANRYRWKDLPAINVSKYNNEIANKISQLNHPEVFFSETDSALLIGYYPVVLHLENVFSTLQQKRGVLYVEYSVDTILRQARAAAFNQSIIMTILFVIASLIIVILLHLLVSRRLARLTIVAREITSGNLDVISGMKGNDELSELGLAFDDMVTRLKRDIGRRKRAEDDLWDLNETLEHRVEQRTQELDVKKQELLDTQAIAHHANKLVAMGEMASGIAHEINSPLQAISLITYKLKRMDASAEENSLKDAAEKIDNIVKTVSKIIESLRRISRSSSNEAYDSVQLKEIVNNVTGITRERYLIKEIDLKISYYENCENEVISCQQTQIAQVLINLLNNAYDAVLEVKDRWITLEVFDAGDVVKFVVTDSGEGIPKEEVEKIFEPMYTSKPIGEGTGLGLSISVDIVHQHNGSLILDQDSKHTRFILTIPKQHKAE